MGYGKWTSAQSKSRVKAPQYGLHPAFPSEKGIGAHKPRVIRHNAVDLLRTAYQKPVRIYLNQRGR
ncbi:Uncharacterised protein [Vibrio cholerae]|nr:Uncharacterised protein [Vibrio cholerae]CSC71819.1 Uncharacterised protein [Vibrio cholerae]